MEDLTKYIDGEGRAALPDGISEIGEEAFKDCTSLTSINIPDSVTEIGEEAFKECPNLTVTCSLDSKAWKYCEKHGIRVSATKN